MIQLVSKVFNCDLPTKAKFVLVCLADSADDYGVCYLGIPSLSRMTSIPERTLQRVLGYLKTHDWLETFWKPTDKIRYKKILHYRIKLDGIPKMPQPDYSNCPSDLREAVIERFEQTCSYCGKEGNEYLGPDGKPWEIDRIISGSRGGGYEAFNVTLSCKQCNMKKGAKMAPQETRSLGAILNKEGCHSEQFVVPNQTNRGATGGTRSVSDPPLNQKKDPVSKEGLDSTSTPTPPNSKENPEASYRMAKRIYRRFCKGNLGNPGESQRESWASLIGSYGEDTVLKAFEIWAQELGAGGKKINYPIALFLKNSDEFLEAVGDTFAGNGKSADPKVLDDDEGEMPTAADIRKQRQGQ